MATVRTAIDASGLSQPLLADVTAAAARLTGLGPFVASTIMKSLIVATVAVSIGISTAMFSVVDALLIRPLPYANSERLVEVGTRLLQATAQSSMVPALTRDRLFALREATHLFCAVEGINSTQ